MQKMLPALKDIARINCLLKISFEYGHVNNDSDNVFTYLNNDSANLYASMALSLAKKINYLKGMANAFENMGEMAYAHNFWEAENYFRQAVFLYDSIHDFENLNWSYLWLGYYLMWQCKFDEAQQVYAKALAYYQQTHNEARQARTYSLSARGYLMEGYYKKSFDCCLKEIAIIQRKIKYQNDPMYMNQRLGVLYQGVGDTATALSYYYRSATYAKGYNKTLYAKILGDISFLQNNYDSALHYYKLTDSSENNSDIGEIYLLKKEYNKALPYFFKPLETAQLVNKTYAVMALQDDIAKDYSYQKKWQLSLKYATQLYEEAKATHVRQFIKDGSFLIWNIYDDEKKKDSAYKYRLQFDYMDDSISADELARNLAVAKMKFDDEQKQSQIDLLKKDNQINQQQLKSESLQKNLLIAGVLAIVTFGFVILRAVTLRRKNERLQNEKKQTELQSKASDLEMQALRSQMNPHFIFNCLSSINRFILKNKTEEASDYLTKFSRLIRMVLNNSKQSFISLEDELETLRLYLEMERLRFKNSFDYSFTYNNSVDLNNIFIPPLLLQPFAENAIWHGLMQKQEKGFLNFDFCDEEKFLICTITDNGVGREHAELLKSKSAEKQKSMGLKITTERLSLLNNNSSRQTFFTIEDLTDENGNATGTRVHLKIFYKEMTEV
jgi:tetratricopeptide (TPR) repeat protein